MSSEERGAAVTGGLVAGAVVFAGEWVTEALATEAEGECLVAVLVGKVLVSGVQGKEQRE